MTTADSSNRIHDRLAAAYPTRFDTTYTQYLKFDLVRRYASPSSVCLDVGVANGLLALPLAELVREVHGVDLSAAMVARCAEAAKASSIDNFFVSRQDAMALAYPPAVFDLAFSYSTLLLVPDARRAYREIHRVLKPGGIAILDITGRFNLSQLYWRAHYRRHGHFGLHAYSRRSAVRELEAAGFEVLASHATGLTDQWKYVPLVRRWSRLERIFHRRADRPDLDYRLSQRLSALANRWYFVLRKEPS